MKKFFFLAVLLLLSGNAWATTYYKSTTAGNWNASASWDLHSNHSGGDGVPAAGDDVIFDSYSANVTVNVSSENLNSLDMNGFNGTTSVSGGSIIIKSSNSVTVRLDGTFSGGAWVRGICIATTTGNTVSFYCNGATFSNCFLIFGSVTGGTYDGLYNILDNLTLDSVSSLYLTAGTLDLEATAGNNHNVGGLALGGTSARTIDFGNSTVNIIGPDTCFSAATTTNLTLASNTATINLTYGGDSSNGQIFSGGGFNWAGITFNLTGSGYHKLTNPGTFYKLNRHASTHGTGDRLVLNDSFTVTDTLTLEGGARNTQLYVHSATLGTAKTITCSGATLALNNADFRDITFARSDSGALDLSAGDTRSVGNCGGNTKSGGDSTTLTFTTAATQTWSGAVDQNWSTATWTSRVPLPQDDMVLSGTATKILSIDIPRIGKDLSVTTACSLTLSTSITSYGSVNFTNLTTLGGANRDWTFESITRDGSATKTITSAGETFPGGVLINSPSTTYDLADALTLYNNDNGQLYHRWGTLSNTSNSTITIPGRLNSDTSSSGTRVLNMGAANWNINGIASGSAWNVSATNLTLNHQNSTINITSTTSTAKTFAGGGLVYYNLKTPKGTGGVTISGSNSFNTIKAITGWDAAGKLTLTQSTTQTFTGDMSAGFGNGTNVLTITSTTTTPAILKLTGSPQSVSADYLALSYNTGQDSAGSTVTPVWHYGANSTVGSGVTGWDSGGGAATDTSKFFQMWS